MTNFYNNRSATSSQENMSGSSGSYDIDSFLDFSAGGSLTPPGALTSDNMLSQSFPAPSFQYDNFPQQTGPFPSQGFSQASTLTSPMTQSNSMEVSPLDFSGGMDMDSFLFSNNQDFSGDFVDPSSMNFKLEEDMDQAKSERSNSAVSTLSEVSTAPSKSHRKSSSQQIDAATEERIKQILDDVKKRAQNSAQENEEPATPSYNLAKAKKDEEDMDEDERLLASEEGKKLSSKERRQLRNKVSARAFRSRRKEYIGQLESEVAAKNNECVELREKNKEIEAENKSLRDLTRMLLASPQFSAFLDQLHPATASNGHALIAMSMPQRQTDNVTVHRASVPEVRVQPPVQPLPQSMDFQPPAYIPPHQYMPMFNPRKDTNPNLVQSGVEDWPLAYPNQNWAVNSSAIFTAEVTENNIDATELAGKSLYETNDFLIPVDGFRPGFTGGIPNEKEEAELDYSHSYDSNGQYIFDVFEDELEEVPEYLFDHFQIHAPVGEEKPAPAPVDAEIVLPSLGLAKLFSDLEDRFTQSSEETEGSVETPTSSCRTSDIHRSIEILETTYRRVGAVCGL